MPAIKSYFLSLLAISVLTFSLGCATLPNVSELIEEARAIHKQPNIFSAEGPLSPAKSKAIMDRLNGSVKPTDVLGRHLAVMESVSAGPPVKGNKVKLLVDGPASNAAIFKAVRGAKEHVNIETYIF